MNKKMKRIFSKTIVKKTRGKQLKQKGGGGDFKYVSNEMPNY